MLKKLLIVLAALVVAFLAYVAMQPADIRVARSAEMAAGPETIFPPYQQSEKI